MTYEEAMTKVREGLNAYRAYWIENYRYPTRVRMNGARCMAFTGGRPGRAGYEYEPTDADKQADDWKVMP